VLAKVLIGGFIKRLLIGIGLGLIIALWWYQYVYAETKVYQYVGQDIVYYNSSNIPAYESWQEYEAKRIADERRYAAVKKTAIAVNTQSKTYCSCVIYAQSLGLGISGYGAARNYPINSLVPAQSGFVFTHESGYGHVAYYVLQGENLLLQEANYQRCRLTTGRLLPVNSGLIRGYVN